VASSLGSMPSRVIAAQFTSTAPGNTGRIESGAARSSAQCSEPPRSAWLRETVIKSKPLSSKALATARPTVPVAPVKITVLLGTWGIPVVFST